MAIRCPPWVILPTSPGSPEFHAACATVLDVTSSGVYGKLRWLGWRIGFQHRSFAPSPSVACKKAHVGCQDSGNLCLCRPLAPRSRHTEQRSVATSLPSQFVRFVYPVYYGWRDLGRVAVLCRALSGFCASSVLLSLVVPSTYAPSYYANLCM